MRTIPLPAALLHTARHLLGADVRGPVAGPPARQDAGSSLRASPAAAATRAISALETPSADPGTHVTIAAPAWETRMPLRLDRRPRRW